MSGLRRLAQRGRYLAKLFGSSLKFVFQKLPVVLVNAFGRNQFISAALTGSAAPAKPWERKGAGQAGSSSATPLGPSTANDGAAKPWETTTSMSLLPMLVTMPGFNF